MKAVIIAAGRGQRLGPHTDEVPKTMVPVLGRPMLDAILEGFEVSGIPQQDVVLISGYQAAVVEAAYPQLSFVRNTGWQDNNILLSLLCAREHLTGGFLSSYADIVYRSEAVDKALASPHDITLVCDTGWRRRYEGRSQHPESDAEKLIAEGDRVVRLSRRIDSREATGEFIGVMRLSPRGAARFLAAFDAARAAHADDATFREGRSFQKAYLVDLLQHMIEAGEPIHCVTMDGGYMEIDTEQDLALAERWWQGSAGGGAGDTV